jgi:uncharacterized membrane protein YkvA (DUF1232 family)
MTADDVEDLGHKAREWIAEEINLPVVIARNESYVRERFWLKLRRFAGRVPFSEDLVAAYHCALDPKTPVRVRAILLAALAYFVLPTDLIPDFIAGFGFTDDATVLATAIGIVGGHIKERHRESARNFLLKPHPAPEARA